MQKKKDEGKKERNTADAYVHSRKFLSPKSDENYICILFFFFYLLDFLAKLKLSGPSPNW